MRNNKPLALVLLVLWAIGGATGCASRMSATGPMAPSGVDLACSESAPHPVGWTVRLAGDNP